MLEESKLIAYIKKHPTHGPKEIGEKLGAARQSVYQMTKRLEREGILKKEPMKWIVCKK